MQPRLVVAPLLFASLLALFACSDDDPPLIIDDDTGIGNDAGFDDADTVDDTDTSAPPPEYCAPCTVDTDCGQGGICLSLLDGERSCGIPCDLDEDDCPDGAYCAVIDGDENTQCVPETLTCAQNCDGVTCPAGQYCDPTSGDCVDEARICDTGCQFDVQCGPIGDYRCLSTGAPDGETMCTTTCDPNVTGEESNLECPSDFFCVPLVEGADEGVCFPLMRTCIDRCHDVSCPGGHNCDPYTGDCVEAYAGACQHCEIDAHCEGQGDLCLNVGIGEGGHCWLDCTADQVCPEGYDCMGFLGLTTRLCIPPAQQCSQCYDADCYPEGICNPVTGECMPHPEDCTVEGCEEDQLCDPLSKRCVDFDRPCSGDSWAVDCDNVITRCTTRRSGTQGVCATLCFDDGDCPDGQSCTSTIHGDICLGPDLGGPDSCGLVSGDSDLVGQPCGEDADSCVAGTHCVETGGVPGFCSQDCSSDSQCPGDSRCGLGLEGTSICLPAQCRCAGHPGFSEVPEEGWQAALDEVELSVCDLVIPPTLLDEALDVDQLHLPSGYLRSLIEYPVAGQGILRATVGELDEASSDPADLVVAAARAVGMDVAPPQITNDASSIEEAIVDFAAASGAVIAPEDVTDEFADVPPDVRTLTARLVTAIDQAYRARQTALDDAGLDQAILEELFDATHRTLLPHSDDQDPLDLDDPTLENALESFPIEPLAQIAADLTATVDAAIVEAALDPDAIGDSFFAFIDTPAGAIAVGDTSDRLYAVSEDPRLDTPLALVLDIGGDNTYQIPVAANQSVQNGISLLVDLDGSDTYTYLKSGDPLDGTHLLESDEAGRSTESSDYGAVSLSETARQATGRLGIGLLFDRGNGFDSYETLRMGQGVGLLGVGALFNEGTGGAQFDAEAFAQGAAMRGVGLLFSAGGDNSYRLWHAGQGFGTGSGVGLLYDRQGIDNYVAVTGTDNTEEILYPSSSDGGNANQNFAQGVGIATDQIAGGLGILRDFSGNDVYLAASYNQGFGSGLGVGLHADGDGDDSYQVRGRSQGVGFDGGAGMLVDAGGDDLFNQDSLPQQLGQGVGNRLGWGVFVVETGINHFRYSLPGGGVGLDGGIGLALLGGGPNDHNNIGGGLGLANFSPGSESLFSQVWTAGFFVQVGAEADTYSHPVDNLDVDNNSLWRQDDDDQPRAVGVGLDQ